MMIELHPLMNQMERYDIKWKILEDGRRILILVPPPQVRM
jgi:hypothetical protein